MGLSVSLCHSLLVPAVSCCVVLLGFGMRHRGSCSIDHIGFLVGIVGGEYFGLSEDGDGSSEEDGDGSSEEYGDSSSGVDIGVELVVMFVYDVEVVEEDVEVVEEDVEVGVAVEGDVFVGSVEMIEGVVVVVVEQLVELVVELAVELVVELVVGLAVELAVELVAQQVVHPVVHLAFELVVECVECAEFL